MTKDLSKCHCDKAGFCHVFNMEMGISPPNFAWCQTATEKQRERFFKSHVPVAQKLKERKDFVPIMNYHDDLPKKTSDFAVCVIPANESAMDLLDVSRDSIKAYAKKCGADYIELTGNQCEDWPIGNKFRLYHVTSVYEKTVFFDCDIIIRGNAPDLFRITPNDKISAYDELHDWPKKEWIFDQYRLINKAFDRHADFNIPKFMINSGVLVIPKSCSLYYRQPDKPYPKIWCFDQQYLSMNLTNDTFFRLDRRWNNTFATIDFWDHIENAYVFHINGIPAESHNVPSHLPMFNPNARVNLMEYFRDTEKPTEYSCKTRNIGLPDEYVLPKEIDEVELVTFHFNLTRSKNMTRTYKIWIESLKNIAPYIKCYEIVYDNREPEIEGSIVIPACSEKNCMWQKESILNMAIEKADPSKKYFAWIDHDECFSSPTWLDETITMIKNGIDFVHLFKKNYYLDKTFSILHYIPSRVYAYKDHWEKRVAIAAREGENETSDTPNILGAPGLGWASTLETLRGLVPLPNTLVGSGDEFLAEGIMRSTNWTSRKDSEAINSHDIEYAQQTQKQISRWVSMAMNKYFNASYCNTNTYHLYHGHLHKRQYETRYNIFERGKLNPEKDVFINDNGLLEFQDGIEITKVAKILKEFFLSRGDDD